MIFVNLRMQGRGLLPDVVTWTPESSFPFFRLTETPQSMPWLAPRRQDPHHRRHRMRSRRPDVDEVRRRAGDAVPGSPRPDRARRPSRRFLGARVLRTPIAYPVFLREYEADRQRFQRDTGVQGLVSVGRNGEFAHMLMEDVYWRTLRRIRRLAEELVRT